MPKGLVIDKDAKPVNDWIGKFNRAMGVRTIYATTDSAAEAFETRLEQSRNDREAANQKVDKLNAALTGMYEERATLEGAAKEQMERRIESYEDALVDQTEEQNYQTKMISSLNAQLNNVRTATSEDTLGPLFDDTQERIEALSQKSNVTGFDKNKAQQFKEYYDLVKKRMEEHHQSFVSYQDATGTWKQYARLNDVQYAFVGVMLTEARLIAVKEGDFAQALKKAEEANNKISEFDGVQLGAIQMADRLKSDPALYDIELSLIDSLIKTLETERYRDAGSPLREEYAAARAEARRAAERLAEDSPVAAIDAEVEKELPVNEELKAVVDALLDKVRTAKSKRDAIEEALDGVQDNIEVMHVNDFLVAAVHEENLAAFRVGTDLVDAETRAKAILEASAKAVQDEIDRTLSDDNVSREQLQLRAKSLDQMYGDLFKHEKDGSIVMIKDSTTGQLKGRKSNKKLPRETLVEIEMKILAANQLLQSQSVDALREANAQLRVIEAVMEKLKTQPDFFDKVGKIIDSMKQRLTTLKKKYGLYEVSRRVELTMQIDELGGAFAKQTPDEILAVGVGYESTLKSIEADVVARKAEFESFEKRAKKLKNDHIDKLGKKIKEAFKNNKFGQPSDDETKAMKLKSYDGKFHTDLESAIAEGEKRDAASINRANWQLVELNTEITGIEALLDKRKDQSYLVGSDDPTQPGDREKLDEFLRDAVAGAKEKKTPRRQEEGLRECAQES